MMEILPHHTSPNRAHQSPTTKLVSWCRSRVAAAENNGRFLECECWHGERASSQKKRFLRPWWRSGNTSKSYLLLPKAFWCWRNRQYLFQKIATWTQQCRRTFPPGQCELNKHSIRSIKCCQSQCLKGISEKATVRCLHRWFQSCASLWSLSHRMLIFKRYDFVDLIFLVCIKMFYNGETKAWLTAK